MALPSSGPLSFSQIGSYLGTGTTTRNLFTMSGRASVALQTPPLSVSELYGYGPTTDGIVVYYDSDFSSSYPGSGTTWTDSVSGITASMNGSVAYTVGASGRTGIPSYFTFDGLAKFFVINNDLYPEISSTGDITVNVWFYPTNVGTRNVLLTKWGGSGGGSYFAMEFGTLGGVYSNSLRAYVAGSNFSTSSIDLRGASNLIVSNPASPYMVTFRYIRASVTAQFYINGNLVSASQVGGNPSGVPIAWNASDANWYMATYRPSFAIDSRMRLYNLMMYNRALSPAEITQNYSSMRFRYGA